MTVSFKNSKHFGESSEIVLTMKMGGGGSFFVHLYSSCILGSGGGGDFETSNFGNHCFLSLIECSDL